LVFFFVFLFVSLFLGRPSLTLGMLAGDVFSYRRVAGRRFLGILASASLGQEGCASGLQEKGKYRFNGSAKHIKL
jgi:hypothetical protein